MIFKLLEKLQLLLKPRLIRCRNRQWLPSIPTVKNLPINCLHSLKVVTKLSRAWGGWVYSTKNNYQAISQNVSKPPIGSVNEAYKRLLVVILCHSVASLRSPVVLSFQNSDVATLPPLGNCFVSGSRPRMPMTVTLFKFAIIQTCDSYCRNSRH